MKKPVVRKLRCAVYTRKSSEEGLEQEFNSLDAQREACEAYVASQKPEGWLLVPDRYDDGGISGATLERPGLQRLLADIEAQRVDVVVVYKIDRLSRALMDFAKLVEVFDRNNLRQRDAVVQHHHVHGTFDAQHSAQLRPVRAGGHRRAHPRQICCLPQEGHVDGGLRSARL
jgi:predicted site-specific integrase-resolvase